MKYHPAINFPAIENVMNLLDECPLCKTENRIEYSYQRFKNNTTHIRTECSACGNFIKYSKQKMDVNL